MTFEGSINQRVVAFVASGLSETGKVDLFSTRRAYIYGQTIASTGTIHHQHGLVHGPGVGITTSGSRVSQWTMFIQAFRGGWTLHIRPPLAKDQARDFRSEQRHIDADPVWTAGIRIHSDVMTLMGYRCYRVS